MAKIPIGLRLDHDLLERVDVARGDVPRARWIERALEAALGDGRTQHSSEPVAPAPALPRAPEWKDVPPISWGGLDHQSRRCELDCGRPVPTSPKVTRCQCGGRLVG